jgi:hypothetical protein
VIKLDNVVSASRPTVWSRETVPPAKHQKFPGFVDGEAAGAGDFLG